MLSIKVLKMQTFMRRTKHLLAFISCLYVANVSGDNNTCGCYMLGTFSSIEGESLCDNKTLQCRCYRNVVGKNCDKCRDGFYDISSGRGCSNCHCSSLGSDNKYCDTSTGQCQCKPGFTGLRCDRCEPFTYKSTIETCQNCNCNPYGSKDLQCNIIGQCPCLPNVEGKHCDRCKENTYSIERGCIPCPPCYGFIQSEIKNYTKYLNTIEQAVELIENNLPLHIQEYKHFLNEIKLLKAKIAKLKMQYEDADKTVLQEEKLQDLVKEADEFYREVVSLNKRLSDKFYYKEIKNLLYVGRTNLREANSLVKTCESALENATQISKSLNRHNKTITNIAKDASATSRDIENKAEELDKLAADVTSSCNEACNTAETFLKNQRVFEDDLQNIRAEIENAADGAQVMKTYLEGFQKKTKASKEEARRLAEEANLLDIPTTGQVSNDLNIVNDNLKSITGALEVFAENSDTVKEKEKSAKDILEQVEIKQKSINDDFLLEQRLDVRADEAISKSNNILKSVQESLNRIEEYEKIKKSAEEALKRIPEIRDKIDAVVNHSEEIKNIFQEILAVIKDLEEMKLQLSDIFKMNEDKKFESEENLKLLEELEKQEREVSTKLQVSHGKIKSVRNTLEDLKKSHDDVKKIIKKIQEYIVVLDTLPTSKQELDEAEEEIIKMEEMVETIEYLNQEKERLQQEIKNIKDIIESIPIDDSTLCESAKSEPKQT